MAIYTGEVIANTNPDYPFIAVVTDETGKVVAEFPVHTEADAEAKIMETLRSLEDLANQQRAGKPKA